MTTRMRRIGALVGGAAVLSFGGYAVGSQAGDGVAQGKSGGGNQRETPRSGGRGGPGARGLDNLADRLGVSASTLEQALAYVRSQLRSPAGDPRDRFAAGLASKLGIDESKVKEALEAQRPGRSEQPREARPGRGGPRCGPGGPGGPDTSALAKALGVDEAKLKTALDELREEHQARHAQRRDEFANALADRLGIDVQKVKDALSMGPPHHGGRGRP